MDMGYGGISYMGVTWRVALSVARLAESWDAGRYGTMVVMMVVVMVDCMGTSQNDQWKRR